MSLVVYYVIIVLEILTGIWCFYRTLKYIGNKNKNEENKAVIKEKEANILIVIPCLRDQDIIVHTLEHFLDLTCSYVFIFEYGGNL